MIQPSSVQMRGEFVVHDLGVHNTRVQRPEFQISLKKQTKVPVSLTPRHV